MNINFLFQGRVRSLDLKKPMRTGSESKYNFKRVLELKGDGSRDFERKADHQGLYHQKHHLHIWHLRYMLIICQLQAWKSLLYVFFAFIFIEQQKTVL